MARGEDLPPSSGGRLSGMDGFFANTHIVLLIILSFCCSYIGLILGVIGLVTCKDPGAKQNAMITTILSAIFAVLGTVGSITLRR